MVGFTCYESSGRRDALGSKVDKQCYLCSGSNRVTGCHLRCLNLQDDDISELVVFVLMLESFKPCTLVGIAPPCRFGYKNLSMRAGRSSR